MTFVSDLEPNALWSHFDHILTIPRPSKGEGAMREYVLSVAERHGFHCRVDGAGNVVISKPGSAGREEAPTTILQSHLDMVQEKNSDVDHDWARDPIVPQQDGEFVRASGTTLGSDNGIGVAAMLAILESEELVHGPLEMLFTMDEESGLTGAAQLDPSLLSGRRLINLDSEEEGKICVGCAGGRDATLDLPLTVEPVPGGWSALAVAVSGLKGGHSGVDIHLQRGNATQLLARGLDAAALDYPLRVAAIAGGNAHNAIPREAHATILVPASEAAAAGEAIERELEAARAEFRPAEPGFSFEVGATEVPDECWTGPCSAAAIRLLTGLPHGVVAMSYDIPGLVETSTNLATVAVSNRSLVVGTSSRSSVASALTALNHKIGAIGRLAGATVREGDGYPGWQPDLESELLAATREVYQEVYEAEPEVYAIHAGLECGLIGEMIDGMDMVSIGPTIQFPHSPDERVHVDSVERFWRVLTTVLERLA